jgi:hypothetical protein
MGEIQNESLPSPAADCVEREFAIFCRPVLPEAEPQNTKGVVTVPDLVFSSIDGAIVRDKFRQFNITLPAVQKGAAIVVGRIAPTAVNPLLAARPQTTQPMLFRAASNSAADVEHQRAMHEVYDSMFQQLLAAIEFGFNLYRQSAGLVDVIINGPQAMGGRLQGPNLDKLILSAPSVTSWTGPKTIMREAVAKGLHQQWSKLAGSVKVPGLPWYPVFAAFPGPMAPPTPNVPTPFITLSHDAGATTPPALNLAMRSLLNGRFDYSDEFFESIATGFDSAVRIWKGVQMVKGVVGTGPVPNFAPPYIPVGQVVGGKVLAGNHINT